MIQDIKRKLLPFIVEKVHLAHDEWPEIKSNHLLEDLIITIIDAGKKSKNYDEINLVNEDLFEGVALNNNEYRIREYGAFANIYGRKYTINFTLGFLNSLDDIRSEEFVSNKKILSFKISDGNKEIISSFTDELNGKPAEIIIKNNKVYGVKNKWDLNRELVYERDELLNEVLRNQNNLSKKEIKKIFKELNQKEGAKYYINTNDEKRLREGNYSTLADNQLIMYITNKQIEEMNSNPTISTKRIVSKTNLGTLLNSQDTKINLIKSSFNYSGYKFFSEFVMLQFDNMKSYTGIFSNNRLLGYDVGIQKNGEYIKVGTCLTDNLKTNSIEAIDVETYKDGKLLQRGTIHDEVSKGHRYVQIRRALLEAFYEKVTSGKNDVSNDTLKYVLLGWDNAIERIQYGMNKKKESTKNE